jgi:hypothetical protein
MFVANAQIDVGLLDSTFEEISLPRKTSLPSRNKVDLGQKEDLHQENT